MRPAMHKSLRTASLFTRFRREPCILFANQTEKLFYNPFNINIPIPVKDLKSSTNCLLRHGRKLFYEYQVVFET